MKKARLNREGLAKILPLLEELADELYGNHGSLWIRVGYDGEFRMETKNPSAFIEEAARSDVTIAYVGKDKFGESCFDVYVPISEIGGVAATGPGQSVTTPVSEPIKSPVAVGAAAKEKEAGKDASQNKEMVKSQIKNIMKNMVDKLSLQ